jgi:glutathione S-transferase
MPPMEFGSIAYPTTGVNPMQTMKLYYSPTSPYVRKVMICVHELGLIEPVQTVPTNVTPTSPPSEYARHNPLMKVPTLERADGKHLFDSLVICEYLDALGGHKLFPAAGNARWDALHLHALGSGINDATLLVRYESALRPAALRWDDWCKGQWSKVDRGLDALDAEAGAWNDTFLIGQVAVTCALGFLDFRFTDRAWRTGRPALAAWFDRVSQRDSVQRTQPRQ